MAEERADEEILEQEGAAGFSAWVSAARKPYLSKVRKLIQFTEKRIIEKMF